MATITALDNAPAPSSALTNAQRFLTPAMKEAMVNTATQIRGKSKDLAVHRAYKKYAMSLAVTTTALDGIFDINNGTWHKFRKGRGLLTTGKGTCSPSELREAWGASPALAPRKLAKPVVKTAATKSHATKPAAVKSAVAKAVAKAHAGLRVTLRLADGQCLTFSVRNVDESARVQSVIHALFNI